MEFATPTVHRTGEHSYHVSHGEDRGLHVEFVMEAVEQTFESQQKGRPIYKDEAFIIIRPPGGKTENKRKVRLEQYGDAPPDTVRWPQQWAQFQAKQEQTQSGTPLEQYPPLSKSQVMELKGCKIFTVEQLSSIPDTGFAGVPILDIRKLRDTAKNYLKNAADGSAVTALEAENARLKGDVEALKAQFAELAAAQPEKRGPGRPRKEENNGD